MPLTITELLEKKLNQKGTNALNIVVSTIGAQPLDELKVRSRILD